MRKSYYIDTNSDNLAILSNVVTQNPSYGTLVYNNGLFGYTPQFDFAGTDQFIYQVTYAGNIIKTGVVNLTLIIAVRPWCGWAMSTAGNVWMFPAPTSRPARP